MAGTSSRKARRAAIDIVEDSASYDTCGKRLTLGFDPLGKMAAAPDRKFVDFEVPKTQHSRLIGKAGA